MKLVNQEYLHSIGLLFSLGLLFIRSSLRFPFLRYVGWERGLCMGWWVYVCVFPRSSPVLPLFFSLYLSLIHSLFPLPLPLFPRYSLALSTFPFPYSLALSTFPFPYSLAHYTFPFPSFPFSLFPYFFFPFPSHAFLFPSLLPFPFPCSPLFPLSPQRR
ncbi:hypothetical protein GLOIN_2v964111 [Rhizophagus irregularis DAOM 181602=DAOM 197198]|uniref:Uncharacterized protein n=1 Tax=Rhizophagus irregularis (strain DAOM 181602 / DAOM 197198 / MUCL 43194) TaxID=747089 RepID=A0A2P4QX06_RHIID|nr:hypothetical protein GLOIN_2v964111 [Rhizophagus irregularis DAOM 181602=DAOM 197198]POG82142.1 hypothetical protein GLOIN_2v964111 [Rhizophagus irregularis DAOM 181602=DAOM 197198]GET57565.1 hypothetical protein GLOIN_2v964111 [Rhizophagus irregularis DAOM 181602=DAOM 197198]|eukprot:XP_025189008.1 hypothetical protein GLOIN_2v964111 [Rhizophagus irregularis DAOM 181602=DAOM 197198]